MPQHPVRGPAASRADLASLRPRAGRDRAVLRARHDSVESHHRRRRRDLGGSVVLGLPHAAPLPARAPPRCGTRTATSTWSGGTRCSSSSPTRCAEASRATGSRASSASATSGDPILAHFRRRFPRHQRRVSGSSRRRGGGDGRRARPTRRAPRRLGLAGPASIALVPRDYIVVASADGLEPERRRWQVAAYADSALDITFVPPRTARGAEVEPAVVSTELSIRAPDGALAVSVSLADGTRVDGLGSVTSGVGAVDDGRGQSDRARRTRRTGATPTCRRRRRRRPRRRRAPCRRGDAPIRANGSNSTSARTAWSMSAVTHRRGPLRRRCLRWHGHDPVSCPAV